MKKLFAWNGLLVFVGACCLPLPAETAVDQQPVVEIPFQFIRGEIVVQTFVNGHGPVSMMLDTGADPSVIEIKMAKPLGLEVATKGGQGSGGGTGINLAYPTTLPTVQIGKSTETKVDAVAMDLSAISSKLGLPIAGILGYNFLERQVVQIDYPKHLVRFFKGALHSPVVPNSPLSKSTTIHFNYDNDIVATGIKVDGQSVKTNIDTGSNSFFQLTPAAVAKLGLAEDVAHAHAISSVGFNGKLESREGTVSKVQVGDISVTQPSMVFYGKGMGWDSEPWDLRIGNDFLKGFVVTFNFKLGKMTLTTP